MTNPSELPVRKLVFLVPLVLSGCATVRPDPAIDLYWAIERPGVMPTSVTQAFTAPGWAVEETILDSDPHVQPMQFPVRVKVAVSLSALDQGVRHAHVRIDADQMGSVDILQSNAKMTIGGQVLHHLQPGEQDVALQPGVPATVRFNDGFVLTIATSAPEQFGRVTANN
jgi:hypothetical protein